MGFAAEPFELGSVLGSADAELPSAEMPDQLDEVEPLRPVTA